MALGSTDNKLATEPFIEKLIFEHRAVVSIAFLVITVFLGYQASLIKPGVDTAILEKMVPIEHPYMQKAKELTAGQKQSDTIGNLLIAVENTQGDIFDPDYLEVLRQIDEEVGFIPGVDQGNMRSLWSSATRWQEVTEDGFRGGPIIDSDYDGSPESIDRIKENINKSLHLGTLVANNYQSSIVSIPLLKIDGSTGKPLQFDTLSERLEKLIRDKYQSENIKIYINGFPKALGDLIEGIRDIALFFAVAIVLTTVLLYIYSRCWKSTIAPLLCSLFAVIWQIGLLKVTDQQINPYSILVPFLVFAMAVRHGVQVVNSVAAEQAEGKSRYEAARITFRALYVPGMLALISDALGFLALLFILIAAIQEMAITAGLGVAAIIVTNLVMLPILMSYMGVSKSSVRHEQAKQNKPMRHWRAIAMFTRTKPALVMILIAIGMVVAGLHFRQGLQIGDLDDGVPELRPESRYNQDNAYVTSNYSVTADTMIIFMKTAKEGCTAYQAVETMDRLQWQLENIPGVLATRSMVNKAKFIYRTYNEANLKWTSLTRNQQLLNVLIGITPAVNEDCSLAYLEVALKDHKAKTLNSVIAVVEQFKQQYDSEISEFYLAAGNAGAAVATNQVIKEADIYMLVFIYTVVGFLCWLTFKSWRAVVCIMLPLGLTSLLTQAIMSQYGIGVKVATLPVTAVGVGIGVDYSIYLYARLKGYLEQNMTLYEAYFKTLKTTGKAVGFTGLTLAIGVGTWVFSDIKFQADMGFLLAFMFLWNMLGALILLPALGRFLFKLSPEQIKEPSATDGDIKAAG